MYQWMINVQMSSFNIASFLVFFAFTSIIQETSSCLTGGVRLVGGSTQFEGRVEICVNGAWGTVCDDDWGNSDATVVCRQLGLPSQGAISFGNARFGQGRGRIVLDDVNCRGFEETLLSCQAYSTHNCDHSEDAGVRCEDDVVCVNGRVRLVGGNTQFEGRVEVCVNGAWGTVCDDSWDNSDARVVCRQLGLQSQGAVSFSGARFGQGRGRIVLDDVDCSGIEVTLLSCRTSSTHNCRHHEDAGVRCRVNCGNSGAVRLVGGSTQFEGRVEICVNGAWGTVCDDDWDNSDATVVCRQLGLSSQGAISFGNASFGQGRGRIVLDDVDCRGFEETLLSCQASSTHDCGHSEDAGVRCEGSQAGSQNVAALAGGISVGFLLVFICLPIGITMLYKYKHRGHRHVTTANGVTTTTQMTLPPTLAVTASRQQEESSQAIYPVESVLQEEPPPSYNDAASYPQPKQNIESGLSHDAPPPYPPGSPQAI